MAVGPVRSDANKISLRKLCGSAEVEENGYGSLTMSVIMNHLVTILFLISWNLLRFLRQLQKAKI